MSAGKEKMSFADYERLGRPCYVRLVGKMPKGAEKVSPAMVRIPPDLAERLFYLTRSPKNGEPWVLPRIEGHNILDIIINYFSERGGRRIS